MSSKQDSKTYQHQYSTEQNWPILCTNYRKYIPPNARFDIYNFQNFPLRGRRVTTSRTHPWHGLSSFPQCWTQIGARDITLLCDTFTMSQRDLATVANVVRLSATVGGPSVVADVRFCLDEHRCQRTRCRLECSGVPCASARPPAATRLVSVASQPLEIYVIVLTHTSVAIWRRPGSRDDTTRV